MNSNVVYLTEFLFLAFIIGVSFIIATVAGFYRAIELQSKYEKVAKDVGIVQGVIDGVVLETIAQINLTFDAAHDIAGLGGSFADWANNITYPFPFGPT